MTSTSALTKNTIFMTFDHKHLDYGVACLQSIVDNYPDYPELCISYEGEDTEDLERIFSIPKTRRIVLEDTERLIEGLDLGPIGSKQVFMRFFAWSSIFDAYDTVLYLDADCLVLGSLAHLFEKETFYMVSDLTLNLIESRIFTPGSATNTPLHQLLASDGLEYAALRNTMSNAGLFVVPKTYRTTSNWEQLWSIARRYNDYLLLGDQSIITLWCAIHGITGHKEFENNLQVEGVYSFNEEVTVAKLKAYATTKEALNVVHFNTLKPHIPTLTRCIANHEIYYKAFTQYQYYLYTAAKTLARKEPIALSNVSLIWIINSDQEEHALKERKYLLSYLENTYVDYEFVLVEYGKHPVYQATLGQREAMHYYHISSDRQLSELDLLKFSLHLATHRKVMIFNGIFVAHPKAVLKAIKCIHEEVHEMIVPYHTNDYCTIDHKMFKKRRGDIDFFPEVCTPHAIDWSSCALCPPTDDQFALLQGYCLIVDRIRCHSSGKLDTIVSADTTITEAITQEPATVPQLPYVRYSFINN